jgi:hypothetical protein
MWTREQEMLLSSRVAPVRSVGKTSLLHRYVNNMFMNNYKATIGSDFVVKETEINGTRVAMQVRFGCDRQRGRSDPLLHFCYML